MHGLFTEMDVLTRQGGGKVRHLPQRSGMEVRWGEEKPVVWLDWEHSFSVSEALCKRVVVNLQLSELKRERGNNAMIRLPCQVKLTESLA